MSHGFIIVFIGLITQIGLPAANPPVERAVLVEQVDHKPYLFLRAEDIRPKGSSIPLPRLAVCPPLPNGAPPFPPGSTVQCFDLTKIHLAITGLPPGLPSAFDSHFPRLNKVTDGSVIELAIRSANTGFRHASSFVDYTGGCVRAPDLSPEVTWTTPVRPPNCQAPGPGPKCVAKYGIYESTPESDVTVLGGSRPFMLAKDAIIAVINLASSGHRGPDYKEHLWMNNGKCMLDLNKTPRACPDKPDSICTHSTKNVGDLVFADDVTISAFVAKYNLDLDCHQQQSPPP